jgi:hypothetical protein
MGDTRGGRDEARRSPAAASAAGLLPSTGTSPYGFATKFSVLDVADVDVGIPLPNWLTFQIRFAVDGSGVAAA